jgi:hypothetical protein
MVAAPTASGQTAGTSIFSRPTSKSPAASAAASGTAISRRRCPTWPQAGPKNHFTTAAEGHGDAVHPEKAADRPEPATDDPQAAADQAQLAAADLQTAADQAQIADDEIQLGAEHPQIAADEKKPVFLQSPKTVAHGKIDG